MDKDDKEVEVVESPGLLLPHLLFEQIEGKRFTFLRADGSTGEDVEIWYGDVKYVPLQDVPWYLPPNRLKYNSYRGLWSEVREYVYEHWDYSVDEAYTVFTTWLLATWVSEFWLSVPYLFFFGPEDSGKTRGLEIIQMLGYRGWLVPSVTAATVFRCDKEYKPTFCLDEVEYLSSQDKKEIIGLLNARYRKGAVIPRLEPMGKNKYALRLYNVFGFTAFAGTQDLLKTTKSRCITFNMTPAARSIRQQVDQNWARDLRGKLLQFRFNIIRDFYFNSEANQLNSNPILNQVGIRLGAEMQMRQIAQPNQPNQPDFTGIKEGVGGRLFELFYPLFILTPSENLNEINKYMLNIKEKKISDFLLSIEGAVVNILKNKYGEIVDFNSLHSDVNKQVDEEVSKIRLARILKKMNLKRIRKWEKDTHKTYILADEAIIKRLEIKLTGNIPTPILPIGKGSAYTSGNEVDQVDQVGGHNETNQFNINLIPTQSQLDFKLGCSAKLFRCSTCGCGPWSLKWAKEHKEIYKDHVIVGVDGVE